jgi:hypothetical protein
MKPLGSGDDLLLRATLGDEAHDLRAGQGHCESVVP